MNIECKLCDKSFSSHKGLHSHLSRTHEISQKKYYEKFYPRFSKLYNKKIKFKNVKDYFDTNFSSDEEMRDWLMSTDHKIAAEYIDVLYKKRIEEKQIKNALCSIELSLSSLPGINLYKHFFKSYISYCKNLNLNFNFSKFIPSDFFDFEYNDEFNIFIDSREQKPIKYKNSQIMKLDFGDYAVGGELYDYTFIDRKSEQDFKSTMSGSNFDRFKRELDRARSFNSYIFMAVESSIESINKNNLFSPHKSKMPYIWHNTKALAQNYQDCLQILFLNNRSELKNMIPRILFYGKKLWQVDVQYFLNKHYERK